MCIIDTHIYKYYLILGRTMEEFIEDIAEKGLGWLEKNWKRVLIFLAIVILFGGILASIKSDVKDTEEEMKKESVGVIVETFTETGDALTETIDDPALKMEIKGMWIFLGLMFALVVVLMIAKAFKPIYDALSAWQISGRVVHRI